MENWLFFNLINVYLLLYSCIIVCSLEIRMKILKDSKKHFFEKQTNHFMWSGVFIFQKVIFTEW